MLPVVLVHVVDIAGLIHVQGFRVEGMLSGRKHVPLRTICTLCS